MTLTSVLWFLVLNKGLSDRLKCTFLSFWDLLELSLGFYKALTRLKFDPVPVFSSHGKHYDIICSWNTGFEVCLKFKSKLWEQPAMLPYLSFVKQKYFLIVLSDNKGNAEGKALKGCVEHKGCTINSGQYPDSPHSARCVSGPISEGNHLSQETPPHTHTHSLLSTGNCWFSTRQDWEVGVSCRRFPVWTFLRALP